MHELSVCLSLLQQVERIAREREAEVVDLIVLKLGPLSGIEPDLLRNAYPLAAAGTIASDAELQIGETDVVVCCRECGAESKVLPNCLICSACGDFRTTLVSGDEMILQRVELRQGMRE